MSTAVDEAKNLIAKGEQIGFNLALELLRLQVAKKGADYIYVSMDGIPATEPNCRCKNLHPAPGADDAVRERAARWPVQESATNWSGYGDENFVPGCIVGGVFVDVVGLELTLVSGAADQTNDAAGAPFDRYANRLLRRAQAKQDCGQPWGQAVDNAAKEYADVV